ncbi:transcriptional regulator STERILE APETALA [Malania oleifera]|uniref:transcriptional regulator STERILE APETALA n=1 Tax=Malania oleifera TaxID=397392 RepID=UPI0025AE113A|nr:transcriptional regulator STERILE APETALA [Malania oleifera]
MSQRESGGDGSRRIRRRRRGREIEGPSSPPRPLLAGNNGVWPEPFLEALATHLAIDAAGTAGRLAAAVALANLFQVCSTWRAVSRSDRLWRRLTRRIWARQRLMHDTWQDEYISCHRTASNFRTGRYQHTLLHFDTSDVDDPVGLICRCLAVSDTHLASGFADGTVRLFLLQTRLHVATFRPNHRDRLGPFSRAVSGIILSDTRLVFASLDGDVHVAAINEVAPPRRAVFGDVFADGALVDFAGCNRWWVGLYAGVPGRAFHVWDGVSEEPIYVGGSLTDPDAVMGWHLLTELTEFVGRVRVVSRDTAVAGTSRGIVVFDLTNQGIVLRDDEAYPRGLIVPSVDASNGAYVAVDGRGLARVRRVDVLVEICRFPVGGGPRRGLMVMGCMNGGYVLMCAGGVIRVWNREVEHGEYLYSFVERIGQPNAMVANDRHVAASCVDTSLHLWDFGAQGE